MCVGIVRIFCCLELYDDGTGNLYFNFTSILDLHTHSYFVSKKRKPRRTAIFMNLLVNKQPSRLRRRSELEHAPSIHQHRQFSLKRRHKDLQPQTATLWLSSMLTGAILTSSIDTRCRSS